MTKVKYISLFFLIFTTSLFCFRKDKSKITVKESHNKLNIYFEGKLRLEGGHFKLQTKSFPVNKLIEENGSYKFQIKNGNVDVSAKSTDESPVISFFLSPNGNQTKNGKDYVGLFFDKIPGFEKGMMFWRYGPWNSWSKPLPVKNIRSLKGGDIQFFYWQYSDGMYGAAMPLSGQGYRTTLGQQDGSFGSKAISYYDSMNKKNVPQMAVGFGKDPYILFETLYKEGLAAIGKEEDLRVKKTFPEIFNGIGWCSWNASKEGTNLNEKLLINSAENFKKAEFPVKWFLIDDGWFDITDSKLNSFHPDKKKFPNGFAPVIEKLKSEYGIADVGIWSTLNGYWQGINPNSELGEQYKNELFSWSEKESPDLPKSKLRTCYFIKPESKYLNKFYDEFYGYLKGEGCSFVKIDNQLITERMAVNNFPIFEGSEKYHEALNSAAAKYFNNTIINCMDMTPEAYLNFGSTAVGRAEDDYYPAYDKKQTYQFVMNKAAGHIMQAVFNSLYFSQMVFPDFDMFESISPNAALYAFTHAISDGPIYITDKVNQHNFKVLEPLVYSDGKILRAGTPLLPMKNSLFQTDDSKPFQAFSTDGNVGLVGTWEVTIQDSTAGYFRPNEIRALEKKQYAVYEYFSKHFTIVDRDETVPYKLYKDKPYKLFYLAPTSHGCAVFGLVNKYNAPAAVLSSEITLHKLSATIYEGGEFMAFMSRKPQSVTVNGKTFPYTLKNGMLTINIPVNETPKPVKIEVGM